MDAGPPTRSPGTEDIAQVDDERQQRLTRFSGLITVCTYFFRVRDLYG